MFAITEFTPRFNIAGLVPLSGARASSGFAGLLALPIGCRA
jgi:hypothetical protein